MYKLTVLYTSINDRAGFDDHFFGTHLPIAAETPGLLSLRVSRFDGGDTPTTIPVIVELLFESSEMADNGMSSKAQQRAMEDFADMAERFGVEATVLRGTEESLPLKK
jgi:uncharacterized protein (TIGR02118 family)